MEFKTKNSNQTKKLAAQLAKKFSKTGGVIALMGDLGAGKTTFTQGFAESLGIKEKIISPTFVITRQHQIPGGHRFLFHIDLYRLEGNIDLRESGIAEMIAEENSIVLIEWPEKVLDKLPKETIKVQFIKENETERRVKIS